LAPFQSWIENPTENLNIGNVSRFIKMGKL
jgi:hypothetical protein